MIFYYLKMDVSIFASLFLFIIYIYTIKQFNSKSTSILLLKILTFACILTLLMEGINGTIMYLKDPELIALNTFTNYIAFIRRNSNAIYIWIISTQIY